MRLRIPQPSVLIFLLLCGCEQPPAEFGPPKTVAKDKRPVEWDRPTKERLQVSAMGPASGGQEREAAAEYVAATPDGWEKLPADPATFRNLRWRVAGEAATDCYLSVAVGGGIAMNMTRWYGQFGAPVADEATLPRVPFLGGEGRLVELEGSYQGKAEFGMLLAFAGSGSRVTSLKFLGPAKVVKAQREAFLRLAASLRAARADERASPAEAPVVAGGSGWRGITPVGWEEQPADPSTFRTLRWRVAGNSDTDCYLSVGVGGGVAMNMNRWFGQFGQPVVDPAALAAVPFAGRDGRLVELEGSYQGKDGRGMLLAFVNDGEQVTSLKFLGPAAVVKEQKPAFLLLAASLRSGGAAPGSAGPAAQSPEHAAPPANPPAPEPAEPFIATIPSGWSRKAGSARPLHHTFGADGEVYVSQLSGDVRQMLEIWRGELGLQPMSDAEFQAVPRCEMLGPDAWFLDLQGDYVGMTGKRIAGARELVAVQKDGGAILFAKLIGPAADVAAQVEAFRAFCASVRRNP